MKALKTFAGAVLALTAAAAFAAPAPQGPRGPKGPDFTNKVYTDIVKITSTKTSDNSGNTTTETNTSDFTGLFDQMSVELTSGKVDAGIKVTSAIGPASELTGVSFTWTSGLTATTDEYWALTGFNLDDWYIEWRPVEMLTVGFHDAIYSAGSYLPVADDNIAQGNFGSDAVLVFRPVAGLRAAAGLDYPSYFGKDDTAPVINLGLDYTYGNLGSFGVTARDVANDERSFGFYASYTGTKDLTANLGFTVNADAFNGVSGNVLNAGAQYMYKGFVAQADMVTNFGAKDNPSYDMYSGLTVTYLATKDISVFVNGTVTADFNDSDDSTTEYSTVFTLQPGVTFRYKENTFKAGVNFTFSGNTTEVKFPVYWKYQI